MMKHCLWAIGVLLLALFGCMPAIKYAGSEYPNNKEGYESLQRDQDARILNSISPADKPFDARALVVLPSQSSIDAESRGRSLRVMSEAKSRGIFPYDDFPPSFFLSHMKIMHAWGLTPDNADDIRIAALNDARERDSQVIIEALRRRHMFKEVLMTRSDSSETFSLPKCEVTIFFDADMTKQETIKVGDSKPESIFEEKPVEEMLGIRERKGIASDPEFARSPWDFIEVKRRTVLLAWLDQLEKSVGRHLKK